MKRPFEGLKGSGLQEKDHSNTRNSVLHPQTNHRSSAMNPKTATDELWHSQPETIRKFVELRPNHQMLCEEIAYILQKVLMAASIEYSAITCRAKALDSFCEKLLRKKYEDPLREITDLAGVRLIYLYGTDRKQIEALIEKEFQVIEKIDKIKQVGPERFGYGALHYLVKLGKRSIGARYDDLKDLVCEVQVRTILQDAWALVAHHLSYKKELDVPEELRRKLNALSGLFETADDQFDRLRDERAQYAKKVKSEISSETKASLNTEVNLDSLTEFLKWRFPDREQGAPDDVAGLLDEIHSSRYRTLAELDSVVSRTQEAVKAYETKYPLSPEDGIGEEGPFTATGAMRAALEYANPDYLRKLFKGHRSDPLLKKTVEFLHLVKPHSGPKQTAARRRGKSRA